MSQSHEIVPDYVSISLGLRLYIDQYHCNLIKYSGQHCAYALCIYQDNL